MISTDLFEFAYVPDWHGQLDALAEMTLPEPWRFRKPAVNVDHILGDAENLERIPAKIRKVKNLSLLLETAVELARRQAVVEPGLVVPQGYQNKLQYLLPICLANMKKPEK